MPVANEEPKRAERNTNCRRSSTFLSFPALAAALTYAGRFGISGNSTFGEPDETGRFRCMSSGASDLLTGPRFASPRAPASTLAVSILSVGAAGAAAFFFAADFFSGVGFDFAAGWAWVLELL